jgi:hypothetical protein
MRKINRHGFANTLNLLVISVFSLVLFSQNVFGSDNQIMWTEEYTADELPQDSSPQWGVFPDYHDCYHGNIHSESVSDGFLTIERLNGYMMFFRREVLYEPFTLEFAMKVDYNNIPWGADRGAYLRFGTLHVSAIVHILPDHIYMSTHPSSVNHLMDTTDKIHLYRITLDEGWTLSLYVDNIFVGSIINVHNDTPGNATAPWGSLMNSFGFGEGGTWCRETLNTSQSQWDFVRWYNGAAYEPLTNNSPTVNAGENLTITSEELFNTVIQGTASDNDSNDQLECRWSEGENVLLDWSPAGLNGECELDLSTISMGIGSHTLTLDVTDGMAITPDHMILTIENSAPHVAPTGGGVFEIWTNVALGGQLSDFDGDGLYYEWLRGTDLLFSGYLYSVSGGDPIQLPVHTISNLPLGSHTLTLSVYDGVNQRVQKDITVAVIDTGDPILSPVPNNTILWPPNHQMVDIQITANAADNSGGIVTLSAIVSSNEPEEGTGDGDMSPDWTEPIIDHESGIITLQLRAERSGSGDNRVYFITISATDESDNSSSTTLEIIVPHNKLKK